MNDMDVILQQLDNMSADDIIQMIGENIYKKVISRDVILSYPQFIQDIIFLVDMDTELQMQGDLTNYSVKKYIPNMVVALKNIRADHEADVLQRISDIYNTIQNEEDEDEDQCEECYMLVDELYDKMYLKTGFDIWSLLEDYVENKKVIK